MAIADPTPEVQDAALSLTHVPTGIQINVQGVALYTAGPNYVPGSSQGDVIQSLMDTFAALPAVWTIEYAVANWACQSTITPTPSETPE